ncbi:Predicted integral membrane protein [Mycobacteroides abscessus subsp. abscessus]|uniref:SdpI family protein n=2 Tax=Mycobacteroides abscessus TaxID=36809 RepID=UPI0009284F79|nr:Predicted integral membrane protein [Mycobacteroides abscessus subsp. abscessus]SKV16461.1 Predicted integral membrane protein [Mycobacteroides abscessus subsp. abscessus]
MVNASCGMIFLALSQAGLWIWLRGRVTSNNLPRNQYVGIRTPSTMRSDAAWRAGQEKGTRLLLWSLPLHGLAAVLMIVNITVWPKTVSFVLLTAVVWLVFYLGWIIFATSRAGSAARAVPESD